MLIPIVVGSALYFIWKSGGLKKTTTSLTLAGPTASSAVKLGGTVGVLPPPGATIISCGPGVPATKTAPLAAAMTPAIAKVVAPSDVAPTAKAAAANIVSDTPTTLAIVTQSVTPAVAAAVPPAAVPAASTAAAANIVSSVPTSQDTLAAAIAPTLLDTVHPDAVLTVANQAAANVTSSLSDTHDAMSATIAPAVAAVVPAAAVPTATQAAVTTTMAGEAGSFMLNPRYMQSWMQDFGSDWDSRSRRGGLQAADGMWGGGHHNIYPPGEIHHAFGRAYTSTWGAEVEAAKHKAGSGKQCVLKPTEVGNTLYTVAWKDATGTTRSTVVSVTATP
jgi:hypothetical protein